MVIVAERAFGSGIRVIAATVVRLLWTTDRTIDVWKPRVDARRPARDAVVQEALPNAFVHLQVGRIHIIETCS